jgi:two-component system OmpR family response regulator
MNEALAVAECRGHRPDVVFLDPMLLPWDRGLALCRRLRRSSQAPVVLLTSRTQDRDVHGGLAAGAADYIGKPFSPRELLKRLDAVLASHYGRADSRRLPLVCASLNAWSIAEPGVSAVQRRHAVAVPNGNDATHPFAPGRWTTSPERG